MPGIVGLITGDPGDGRAERQLSQMLQSMLHDRSYSCGTYCVPERGWYLGWAGHNGSADHNPVVADGGEVALVFAGERFGCNAAANSAERGGGLRDVLESYRHHGERFVRDLNGWFAGAIIDRQRGTVLVFNDRFGIHRVYWHQAGDCLAFASEAKAILAIRPESRCFDARALGEYLALGTPLGNRTLFAGISLMPGASVWTVRQPTGVEKRAYFRPAEWEEQPELEPETFYHAFRDTLSSVVPQYFRADAQIGVSLTGGLDTRIVMAAMPASRIVAYTYAGAYRDCFDVAVARQVANLCGQPHQVLSIGADFFERFETFAEQTIWLTDGCLDLCGSHEIYYSTLARQLSPIRLTGNYGSEVLRGASTFKYTAPSRTLFDPALVESSLHGALELAALESKHPVTFAAFHEIPRNLFGRLAAAQAKLTVRSPYTDNRLVKLMYQAPAPSRSGSVVSWRLVGDLKRPLAAIPTDMGYGVAAAVPSALLRLYRYLLFKAEWYYNAGMPDWLSRFDQRNLLRPLERLFLGSHKIDHYRLWFRRELSEYIRSLLTDERSRSRAYLVRRGLDDLLHADRRGRRNCLGDINKVATLELIQRSLLNNRYSPALSAPPAVFAACS